MEGRGLEMPRWNGLICGGSLAYTLAGVKVDGLLGVWIGEGRMVPRMCTVVRWGTVPGHVVFSAQFGDS